MRGGVALSSPATAAAALPWRYAGSAVQDVDGRETCGFVDVRDDFHQTATGGAPPLLASRL
jgi:hypothetical protein